MKRLMERAQLAVTLLGAFFAISTANAAKPQVESVPGEYVVKLRTPLKAYNNQMNVLGASLKSYIKSTIPSANIVVIKRPVIETQHSVLKTLAQNPNVEIVEPNYIYRINKTPNDPMLGQLWGMANSGQKDSDQNDGVVGVDIGAEQAWDLQTGNKDAIIAVIDTGVDYTNPDLIDNMWTNEVEAAGKPGVDDDNNGVIDDIHGYNANANTGDPKDDHGHGSHCSGTIGAKGDDGKGIVGVTWNTRIMGVKFLDRNGSGSLEDAIKAIDYATKMGAKVMSNSWGGGGESQTLKEAIQRSHEAGALFVAAAGNDSNDNDSSPSYPASYNVPNVLAVAAIDNRGSMASFSSYGKNSVHVGAPGVNVLSTTTNNQYESWSGTSMATPHVSGIAALLIAHQPTLTNLEVRERIITTAKPLTALRGKVRSGGIANAYTALTNEVPPPDMNDPINWQTVDVSVSTPHPYKEKMTETYEVRVPGAKEIALYFEKFQTEKSYDFAELQDASGKIIKVSGNNDASFSPVIAGEYVKITFKSDDSVNGYGFDITKAAWR